MKRKGINEWRKETLLLVGLGEGFLFNYFFHWALVALSCSFDRERVRGIACGLLAGSESFCREDRTWLFRPCEVEPIDFA